MKSTLLRWVTVLSLWVSPAFATSSYFFIPKDSVDWLHILPPSPSKDSTLGRDDYRVLLQYQNTRTDADCQRAAAQVGVSVISFFGPDVGPLSAGEVARWQDFLGRVRSDASDSIGKAKNYWNRPRPYDGFAGLSPCIRRESSKAYPSGHSTLAWLWAHVLAQLSPRRASIFFERAAQAAENRVIGGVHHPSDIRAGKLLAEEIFRQLQESPLYLQEVARLKEVTHANRRPSELARPRPSLQMIEALTEAALLGF